MLILRKIRDEPSYGRNIVKLLQLACVRYNSHGCSGRSNQNGGGGGGAVNGNNSGGGGSFGGYTSSGGGSPNSVRSGSTDNNDDVLFDPTIEFSSIDFDLPATRRWLNENPEFNPLKILDHITLKGSFEGPGGQGAPKPPPDVSAMDRDTASILQLAVPVPDPSATFLDIGTDLGPMSMYEDDPFNLETVNPSNFTISEPTYEPPMKTMRGGTAPVYNNNNHNMMGFPSMLSETSQPLNQLYTPGPAQVKMEPTYVKEELFPESSHSPPEGVRVMSPPHGTCGEGGRKRTFSASEEEDLTNVPSLQMRISILQQRVSSSCVTFFY